MPAPGDPGTRTPRVSVVIPFLDGDNFIREAVASVLAQQPADWELILVDDGSTDGSADYARQLAQADPRITRLAHPGGANRGAAQSRRLGLDAARSEFLLFLDHDDLLLPGALARLAAMLDAHPGAAAVFAGTLHDHVASGRRIAVDFAPLPDGMIAGRALTRDMLGSDRHHPQPGSSLFRRSALHAALAGSPPFSAPVYEDSAMVLALLAGHDACLMNEAASVYRIHPASRCAQSEREGTYADTAWCADRLVFLRWARESLRLDLATRLLLAVQLAALPLVGALAGVARRLPGPLRKALRRALPRAGG